MIFTRSHRTLVTVISIVILVVGVGVFTFLELNKSKEIIVIEEVIPTNENVAEEAKVNKSIIGLSVEGRAIEVNTFGSGEKHLLFVGGIHGGYEWNSVVLAYTLIDFLEQNPEYIPKEVRVSIIPSANPDGLFKVIKKEGRISISDVPTTTLPTGTGRFNALGVDLNRNFDCKWKPESTWRGKTVSAGTEAFSEPESKALQKFIVESEPQAVVFWHSQANAVYASECENGILPQTKLIMNTYASAAGYSAIESFDAYPVSGDAEGWLASIGIPAITVELKTHETIEWEKNLRGVSALIDLYTLP